MKKIALIGSQNSGKTTSLYYLSYKLKKESNPLGVGHEVARECPYPLNQGGGLLTQLWILFKQMENEAKLEQYYENIILDRSVYDQIAYTGYLADNGTITQANHNFMKHISFSWAKIHPYDLLVYLEPLPLEKDIMRGENLLDYQREINRRFKLLTKTLPEKIITVKVFPKEKRCKEVFKIVSEELYDNYKP